MKILATTGMGLFLLGLAACIDHGFNLFSDSDLCGNPCTIGGTYALQSIDGQALPVVVSELTDPILVEVTAGSVTINYEFSPSQPSHGTCSVSSTTGETMTDGTTTMETETKLCTFTFNFNTQALTLTFSPDSTVNGTISDGNDGDGTTLTLYADGSIFVYWVSVGLLPFTG